MAAWHVGSERLTVGFDGSTVVPHARRLEGSADLFLLIRGRRRRHHEGIVVAKLKQDSRKIKSQFIGVAMGASFILVCSILASNSC